MPSSKLDLLAAVAACLALFMGATETSLLDSAQSSWANSWQRTTGFYWPDSYLNPEYQGPTHYVNFTPLRLNMTLVKLGIAAGALTIITSFFAVSRSLWFRRLDYRVKSRALMQSDGVIVVLNWISALFALAALIYVFIVESRDPEWHYSGPGSSDGQWTLGGWTCEIRQQFDPRGVDVLNTICNNTRAAKWVMIPLVVMSLVSAIIQVLGYRSHRVKAMMQDSAGGLELKNQSHESGMT